MKKIIVKTIKLSLILSCLTASTSFARTVLYIGDSHSADSYGQKLSNKLLANKDIDLAFYGSCGSIARWYFLGTKTPCGFYSVEDKVKTSSKTAATPIITTLIDKQRPDLVVVELGTNYADYDDSYVIRDMKKLVALIIEKKALCLWVTPPDMRKYRNDLPRFKRLITAAVEGQCKIIESDKVTHYPASGGDGIHYGSLSPESTEAWANLIYQNIIEY